MSGIRIIVLECTHCGSGNRVATCERCGCAFVLGHEGAANRSNGAASPIACGCCSAKTQGKLAAAVYAEVQQRTCLA